MIQEHRGEGDDTTTLARQTYAQEGLSAGRLALRIPNSAHPLGKRIPVRSHLEVVLVFRTVTVRAASSRNLEREQLGCAGRVVSL